MRSSSVRVGFWVFLSLLLLVLAGGPAAGWAADPVSSSGGSASSAIGSNQLPLVGVMAGNGSMSAAGWMTGFALLSLCLIPIGSAFIDDWTDRSSDGRRVEPARPEELETERRFDRAA
jgi:hypothetical protein